MFYQHNTPVASLVLASGKTRMLVYSAAIATIISISFLIFTADILHIGAAVIGFLIYIIIQMSFYYGYYNNKVFNLDSFDLFWKSFFKPSVFTILPVILISFIANYYFQNFSSIQSLIVKTTIYHIIYIPILFLFIIKIDEMKYLVKRIIK